MSAAEQPKHQTLSGYLATIEAAIKKVLPDSAWCVAELSSFSAKPNGTVFMDLVESVDGKEVAKAAGCVMFANVGKKVLDQWRAVAGGLPEAGMKVLVKVRPDFSTQYGFKLHVISIDPSYTLGDMQAKMREIIARLKDQHLFDKQRSLADPTGFWRVGVVSPHEAAGLADFRQDADKLASAGVCSFEYFTATFQGEVSSHSIRDALRSLYERHQSEPFDVVCVIRGGGAKTDLAWLNDFELARWVCRIPIPVFTGIGHQVDETILDLVAHRRFDTPSKVIGHIKSSLSHEASNLRASIDKATNGIQWLLAAQAPALDRANARFSAGAQRVAHYQRTKCDRAESAFSRLATKTMAEHREWLQWVPEAFMRHAFTVTTTERPLIDRYMNRFCSGTEKVMHAEMVGCDRARSDFSRLVTRLIRNERERFQRTPDAFNRRSHALCATQRSAIELASSQVSSRAHLVLERAKTRLDTACLLYDKINPLTLLAKGFALVRGRDGMVITSAAQARSAGAVDLAFADGHVDAIVTSPGEPVTRDHRPSP